jgi:hypothetical protein
MTKKSRIHGYAIAIEDCRGAVPTFAHILDGSRVLYPESIVDGEQEPKRFEFVEYFGEGIAPTHCRHVCGDIFVPDGVTARFVRDAINEKLERHRDLAVDRNAFEIFATVIREINGEDVLTIATVALKGGASRTLEFVLTSRDRHRQNAGQYSFASLCNAVGITEIENAELLHGRVATFAGLRDGRQLFRAVDQRPWHTQSLALAA